MGSVVTEYRKNKDGTLCGPYYYRYTYTGGQRVKAYLSRDEGERQPRRLCVTRQGIPRPMVKLSDQGHT